MNNKTVNEAINNTKKYLGEYFTNTCRQRLSNGTGSIFEGIDTPEEMEQALRQANWTAAEHPDVIPGCKAFKTTDIKGGHFGLVKIVDLPDDAVIVASDPKGTGKISMTVSGCMGPATQETWLIVGDEEGHEVVFTFHPGEPVRPSILEVSDCPDGMRLSKQEALDLGFDFAKISQ